MNEEIFKLEELLKQNDIPFYFNYREENRPTPFGEGGENEIDWSKEPLCITIGPVMEGGRYDHHPIEVSDKFLTHEPLVITDSMDKSILGSRTAEQAYEYIKEKFLEHRAEWWPAVYGEQDS